MREKRLELKRMRELREKEKYEENRRKLELMHEEMRKKKVAEEAAKMGMDENSYLKMRNIQMGLSPDEGLNLKVTLEDLERMNYKDIQTNTPDDFKPGLVIKRERQPDPMQEVAKMIEGSEDETQVVDPQVARNFQEKLFHIK